MRAAGDRLGLSDRLTVRGWASPEMVVGLLASSHILALPSFEENLPMAVIEAFAAGLAVVTTPVGSIPDIVIPEETGLLVPPGDALALAGALGRLIDDAPLRERLSRNAQALHARHLSLDAYLEDLSAIWTSAGARRY